MDVQDLSQNPRITRLTRLTRDLEQSRTPAQTLEVVRQALDDAHGFIPSVMLSTRGLGAGCYRVAGVRLNDGCRGGQDHARWGDPNFVRSGGVMGAIIGSPEPRLIQDVDWSSDPCFREALGSYRSVMAIPLAGHHLPMDWAVLLREPPERFSVFDLEEAVERVALIGALLENQVLAAELTRANEQLEEDARQVGKLQRALLPASLPRIAGLEIAASFQPAARAGGDIYDFFPVEERRNGRTAGFVHGNRTARDATHPSRWFVFIGDAAGHGLATAVVIAIVQAVLHAHPAGTARPATLLAHANRQLCSKRLGGFVTAFLGVYEPGPRQLTYSNAGHPPPLHLRSADGSVVPLDEVATHPLGIDASAAFADAVVQFERGDTFLLYTDGITEARDKAKSLFGSDRIARALSDPADPPAELVGRLCEAVRSHEDGQAAADDQTMVAARIL